MQEANTWRLMRSPMNADPHNGPAMPGPQGKPDEYFEPTTLEGEEFEIALVLGGTVSVGSYTAGVLDFLIEALDAWEARKRSDAKHTPNHRVRLRIITGTSGGGVTALLTARALHYRFLPATAGADSETLACNPFYNVWVKSPTIEKMLKSGDLKVRAGEEPPTLDSLLNGHVLTDIANQALDYPAHVNIAVRNGQPLVRAIDGDARPYVHNPLPVIVTHSNVSGIPYRQLYKGTFGAEYFTSHADYVRIYFDFPSQATPHQPQLIPDAICVHAANGSPGPLQLGQISAAIALSVVPWPELAQYALGTCALPIGLPARTVNRSALHYIYRFVWSTADGAYEWMTPVWERFLDAVQAAKYNFACLDGGCTNNEPIALARQSLEGLRPLYGAKRPPVEADNAERALILVDPLCEEPARYKPDAPLGLIAICPSAASMFLAANRFATADMADFIHPQMYTRFLVAPKRTGRFAQDRPTIGADALCGTGLGAFLGFASEFYRDHDFQLGRYNCQAFLAGTLTFAHTNRRFGSIKPSCPASHLPQPGNGEVPLIPLFGTANDPIAEPEWPFDKFKPATLKKAARSRFRKILSASERMLHRNPAERALFAAGNLWIAHKLTTIFLAQLTTVCVRKRLLPGPAKDGRVGS